METNSQTISNEVVNQAIKKNRGRPEVNISWPTDSSFTLNDVVTLNDGLLSKAAIQIKLRKAVLAQKLTVTGSTPKTTKGRPSYIYQAK